MKEFKIGQVVKIGDNATARHWSLGSLIGRVFTVKSLDEDTENTIGPEGYFVPPKACILVRDVKDVIDHSDMVSALVKQGSAIQQELTAEDCHAMHMMMGISGESGELLDAVKKHIIYRKPLDRENVVEELGDLEFYMEGLRQGLGITREETIEANVKKLSKRYEGFKYSDAAAQERADKK